eukprot:scaffold275645_cov54-Attheya_sp.AAC.3
MGTALSKLCRIRQKDRHPDDDDNPPLIQDPTVIDFIQTAEPVLIGSFYMLAFVAFMNVFPLSINMFLSLEKTYCTPLNSKASSSSMFAIQKINW